MQANICIALKAPRCVRNTEPRDDTVLSLVSVRFIQVPARCFRDSDIPIVYLGEGAEGVGGSRMGCSV